MSSRFQPKISHLEKTIKVRKLIEYLLNDINEYSTAMYLRHVHGQAVADLFAGDDLYGVDMSLPIHESDPCGSCARSLCGGKKKVGGSR